MSYLIYLTLLVTSVLGKSNDYDSRNEIYWNSFAHHDPELTKVCTQGTRQSPIDIPKTGNIKVKYDSFEFKRYDATIKSKKITNNGHTVKLSFESNTVHPMISGGGLGSDFQFAQLHFHWGEKDSYGSEHTIGQLEYPIELHLVHFNKKYGNDLSYVVTHSNNSYDTLAVLGVMFTIQKNDNKDLKPIINALNKIKNQGTSQKIDAFPMKKLLPADTSSFYRYSGSLTTPLCNEIVVWTVFKNPIGISQRQLKEFRSLTFGQDKKPLVNTYRNVQALNGRQIFESVSSSSIMAVSRLIILGLFIMTVISN